ncbi:MAG TPA: Holliday junction branch migration protein RuvA [Gammaproteobacteria bacterium]|nr:Holliday junction branch migration protein RuvA [Gammaproteobacteria bacterium]HBF08958.1 Holliday junction branch migration protein RuvA [Gammaproteobacteria bacterium]HCK93390.1 Holliday junction branch migration protein RuvA [Gammaproteobacteria bacterium]|tara:strand:+ start:289 stop:921 length:633 start_codon:yes stop_codon:yes gene_type:complete
MIAFLKGTIVVKEPPVIVLDVQGVGYELKVPLSGFYDLPEVGKTAMLYVHVVYREDSQNAYGFLEATDRDFFRELIKVNGVGPNLAHTILSGLSVQECVRAVEDNYLGSLTALPGIGKRTAERLILELKPRIEKWLKNNSSAVQQAIEISTPTFAHHYADAEAALLSLGYKPTEAKKALDKVNKTHDNAVTDFTSEDYIRNALKVLVPSQ